MVQLAQAMAMLTQRLAGRWALACLALAFCMTSALATAQPAPPTPAAAAGAKAQASDGAEELNELDGLYVVVEASQRPLDGVLVMPPACGSIRGVCDTVRTVLHNDLHLSGVVRALKLPSAKVAAIKKYAPPHFEVNRKAARSAEVVYAVGSWVRRARQHRGMLELHVAVLDTRTGKSLNLGRHAIHRGPPSRIRTLTHRASNAIFGALTGVEGSFDDQVFYSAPAPGCARCIWIADVDGYNARILIGDDSIHMLPRQTLDLGTTYVSFRNGLPSLFRLTGAQVDLLARTAANVVTPAPDLATKSKKRTKKAKGKDPVPATVKHVPFAASPDLQFRTAAQSVTGRIAATINDGEQADIWLLDKAGRPVLNLTRDPADDLDPTWSPDGSLLAFVSDRSGSPQIYVVGVDGSGLQRLTFAGRYNTGPDWGPSGKIVYSGLRGSAVDILTVDMSKQMQRLTPGKGRRSLEPSWSPCGRRVLYVSDEDGQKPRLWIASHDGAVRHPLAIPGGRYYTPAWRHKPGQRPKPFIP